MRQACCIWADSWPAARPTVSPNVGTPRTRAAGSWTILELLCPTIVPCRLSYVQPRLMRVEPSCFEGEEGLQVNRPSAMPLWSAISTSSNLM